VSPGGRVATNFSPAESPAVKAVLGYENALKTLVLLHSFAYFLGSEGLCTLHFSGYGKRRQLLHKCQRGMTVSVSGVMVLANYYTGCGRKK